MIMIIFALKVPTTVSDPSANVLMLMRDKERMIDVRRYEIMLISCSDSATGV